MLCMAILFTNWQGEDNSYFVATNYLLARWFGFGLFVRNRHNHGAEDKMMPKPGIESWSILHYTKPVLPVLGCSILGVHIILYFYYIIYNLATLGSYLDSFLCWEIEVLLATVNYFSANQNWHTVSTVWFSSKMDTTGTKTFTSEWVLFGRLIFRILGRFDCVLLAWFYNTIKMFVLLVWLRVLYFCNIY